MAKFYVNHTKISLYDFFFANKVRKTYTNLGVSLILVIVLLVFALRPTLLTINTIRNRITEYEKVNASVEQKVLAAQQLAQQKSFSSEDYSGGLRDEIDFLDNVFFSDPNIKLLYKNLYERAKRNNVAIKGINPKYVYANTNVVLSQEVFDVSGLSPSKKYYEFTLSFEGKDIKDVENYINTLEGYIENPIFSRIKNVSINNVIEDNRVKKITNPNRQGAENDVINATIVMVIYLVESEQ